MTFIMRVEGYKTFSKHASESFHSKTQKLYLKLKNGKNRYRSLLSKPRRTNLPTRKDIIWEPVEAKRRLKKRKI